uniref:C2H2-type domain-containing protein n=1 Tax=Takifugu rubripes TaxID=31033 RepID=A0A674MNM0_TAKRU
MLKSSNLVLISYSPHISESKDEENRTSGDSRWTTAEEPKQTMKQNHPRCQTGNVNSPAESAVDCDTDTGAKTSACNTGEQQGKLKADMAGHSTINPNDTPHVGLACGKGSRGQRSSSADDKSHTGAKLFICETCGKDFNINSALKSHIRSHTGKRLYLPYVCKTCGKTFKRITILKNHFRVHTGERPYLCKTCGKAFMDRSSLKVHMRVHTGERPYLCKICGKTFLRINSSLNKHMRIHSPSVLDPPKRAGTLNYCLVHTHKQLSEPIPQPEGAEKQPQEPQR